MFSTNVSLKERFRPRINLTNMTHVAFLRVLDFNMAVQENFASKFFITQLTVFVEHFIMKTIVTVHSHLLTCSIRTENTLQEVIIVNCQMKLQVFTFFKS